MQRRKQVVLSDGRKSRGDEMSTQAEVNLVHDAAIQPVLWLGDSRIPIAVTRPVAAYFTPGATDVVNIVDVVEGPDDIAEVARWLQDYRSGIYSCYSTQIDELVAKVRGRLPDDEGPFSITGKEPFAIFRPGLARNLFPDLFDEKDADANLVELRDLTQHDEGIYERDGFLLFAHSFLRRHHASMNALNLGLLQALSEARNTGLATRIAIDPDMVGLASSFAIFRDVAPVTKTTFERSVFEDADGTYVYDAPETLRRTFWLDRLEVWMHSDAASGLRTVEIEEVPEEAKIDGPRPDRWACRYVHSIQDQAQHAIRHLDGAIRAYTDDQIDRRWSLPIDKAGKDTTKIKLWRVDGDSIPPHLWTRLVFHFFQDDPLIAIPLLATEETPDDSVRAEARPIEEFVPHSVQRGDGIRLALTFREVKDGPKGVALMTSATIAIDGETHPAIEPGGLEFLKLLRHSLGTVDVPEGVTQVVFAERYCCLPLLVLPDGAVPDDLYQGLRAVKRIIRRLAGKDWVLRFGLGFSINTKYVMLSVLGHVDDLGLMLKNEGVFRPPMEAERFEDWFLRLRTWIDSKWPHRADSVDTVLSRVDDLGIIDLERHAAPAESADLVSQGADAFLGHLPLAGLEGEVLERGIASGAQPTLGMAILESSCRRCQQSYISCTCSRLEDSAGQEVRSCRPLPPVWTDRMHVPMTKAMELK